MEAAVKSACIAPDQVDYINAHGTSTYYNDMYESEAIMSVFKEHAYNLSVSSTKSVTGHCLGAAGGLEAVFLAKSIYEQTVPPTANLESVDPKCPLDYTPKTPKEKEIGYGLSNSFGFGGTNGTIVMKKLTS